MTSTGMYFIICDVPREKGPDAPKENFTGQAIYEKGNKENYGREAQPTKIIPFTFNTV